MFFHLELSILRWHTEMSDIIFEILNVKKYIYILPGFSQFHKPFKFIWTSTFVGMSAKGKTKAEKARNDISQDSQKVVPSKNVLRFQRFHTLQAS